MPELTPTPETANAPETGKPETTESPSKLTSLRDLLSVEEGTGEAAETQQKAEPNKGTETAKSKKPDSLKALAETLKLEDKDLYAIKIPFANGESRTLGEIKDLVGKQDDFTLRELQFEEDRVRKEQDLIRGQNELRELVAALPKNALKPEVVNAMRQKHEAAMNRERQRTLDVIPEWQDEGKRGQEIAEIVEHLKAYGFPANYLNSIYDHRTFKYIRENYLREKRMNAALAGVKQVPPSSTPKSRPVPKKLPPNASRPTQGRQSDKLANFLSEK